MWWENVPFPTQKPVCSKADWIDYTPKAFGKKFFLRKDRASHPNTYLLSVLIFCYYPHKKVKMHIPCHILDQKKWLWKGPRCNQWSSQWVTITMGDHRMNLHRGRSLMTLLTPKWCILKCVHENHAHVSTLYNRFPSTTTSEKSCGIFGVLSPSNGGPYLE